MKLKVNKNKTFYKNKQSTAQNEATIKMSLDKYAEKIDNLQ